MLKWRNRYGTSGIDTLGNLPRLGRPGTVDEVAVLVATLAEDGRPRAHPGVTHWSSRLRGRDLGLSFSAVAKVWRKWGIQPHRAGTFKFSTDPALEPKIRDIVGLYLAPPEKAVVVCVAWLNMVEIFFGIITRQAVRRGTFASVGDLKAAIRAFIDGYNARCEPFTWTKTADQILNKVKRK